VEDVGLVMISLLMSSCHNKDFLNNVNFVVIMCHSVNYDTFNAVINIHKDSFMFMTVPCQSYAHPFK